MSLGGILGLVQSHPTLIWWLVVFSAFTFVASIIAVPWMLVRIPSDYFAHDRVHPMLFSEYHPVARAVLVFARNLLGLALVAAGVAMLVLPGQGVLTILAGIILLHFPGKDRLVRWIVCRPAVLASVNWIRGRAGEPPLRV